MYQSSKTSPQNMWNAAGLDVCAFALVGQVLQGIDALEGFDRLRGQLVTGVGVGASVEWRCAGEMRPDNGGNSAPWLHLEAKVTVPLQCQRCLGSVEHALEVDRWYRFVVDEAAAELEDEASDEDVLALEPRPDITQLVEDELLMALPLVPMHETCPELVPMQTGNLGKFGGRERAPENPFAKLAQLKKNGGDAIL